MANKKNRKTSSVKKACREIGVSVFELWRRAYHWAHGVLDLDKVRAHYLNFKKRGVITPYLNDFLLGSHHKVQPA